MGRSVPILRAFNAGELSPLMLGRTDQDKYFSGCRTLLNMIPLVQGPVTRRGGTRYVGNVANAANRTWLTSFEFSETQSYILEFGDYYLRFWANRGQLYNGGSPYQIATPWSAASLMTSDGTFALRTAQSADVMWICHAQGATAPYKLARYGATNWTLTAVPFSDGPVQNVNPQTGTTVTASGTTGSVTLTASAGIWQASDVGTVFYLETVDPCLISQWQTSTNSVAVGSVWAYNGNVYQCVAVRGSTTTGSGGVTGTTPPTHVRGTAWDGVGNAMGSSGAGVKWQYLHSNYGFVLITGFTDSQHVTGTVVTSLQTGAQPTQLPADFTTAGAVQADGTILSRPTNRWALSQFSAARGWPTDVKFFRGRLIYIQGNFVVASMTGSYDTFSRQDGAQMLSTCGMLLQLPVESLSWVAPADALLCGTPKGERSIQEQTTTQVFSASNTKDVEETEYGAKQVEPQRIAEAVLFVQRAGRKLREMKFDINVNKYSAEDLTVLSEHILLTGVVDMDFAQEPDTLLWCALGDGSLAALTYNRDRGVVSWSRHQLGGGGFVEAVAVIPAPDGSKDDLWMLVLRTINGATVRSVEFMEDRALYKTGTQNAFYVDCGITYVGAATMTISGLSYLNGCTVSVLADGAPQADCVVSGGQITLLQAASTVQIGFNFTSVVQPMPLDTGADDGTAQSRFKAISELWLRVVDTIGGEAGPSMAALDWIPGVPLQTPIGVAPALYTGDIQLGWDDGYATDAPVFIVQQQPLPMTLIALMPRVNVND